MNMSLILEMLLFLIRVHSCLKSFIFNPKYTSVRFSFLSFSSVCQSLILSLSRNYLYSVNVNIFVGKLILYMIKLENVSKGYSEGKVLHTILSGVDLNINKGEIIIIYGKSGSGKSTLLNLLAGIDLPDEGNIFFGDINITALNEKQRTLFRRKSIGFIFQFFNLIPTLTVSENLKLPLELNSLSFNIADKMIDEVGLLDRKNAYPDVLSGGEQQRVAIARALIHNPDFILADEPTGNLDFDTSKQIIDFIDRIVKQQGKTMIMATHSREVIGLADRVLTLKDGKFIEMN